METPWGGRLGELAVKWQCEYRRLGEPRNNSERMWIDYAPVYNIALEAAWLARLDFVVLQAAENQAAEGDWYCNLVTLVQRNTSTGAERTMRRVLVTHGNLDAYEG